MNDPYFFGYGSLVNLATHSYGNANPAQVTGWQRVWRHTPSSDIAFLTVEPATGITIDGLIAAVPNDDWQALDLREIAYDRQNINRDLSHSLSQKIDAAIYTIPVEKHGLAQKKQPILLSYLDVVVQGYLQHFGPAGVSRFFATTAGWTAPILDDRKNPIYPRHQVLTAQESDLVDRHVAGLPTVVKQAL